MVEKRKLQGPPRPQPIFSMYAGLKHEGSLGSAISALSVY